MSDSATRTHIATVHTVSVPVTDQDQALEFYVGVLGFEKRRDMPFGGGQRWIEVAPAGAATTIALAPAREGVAPGDTGIRLATTDVDADHAALRAQGVDTDPEILRFGNGVPPMFTFRDPDGNNLFLVEAS